MSCDISDTLYHTWMWLFTKHKSSQINRLQIRFWKIYLIKCVRWGELILIKSTEDLKWDKPNMYYIRYELVLDLHLEKCTMFSSEY